MIADLLIPKLQQRFPGRGLRIGAPSEPCATFPAVHPEVGDIVIQDDGDEVTLYAGNFTHGHFSNYEKNLSQDQKAEHIAEDVVAFLEELFADRIILWGSHRGVGGWHRRDVTPKPKTRGRVYVWSGPLSSG